MKLSWGYKIAFLYSGFVVLILTLVVLTFRQKVELTYTDYYNREVNYQNTLTGMDNFNALKADLQINQSDKAFEVKLPVAAINGLQEGKLSLFRPNDSKLDLQIPFNSQNASSLTIPKDKLVKGFYLLQLTWKNGNKDFYVERSIMIN